MSSNTTRQENGNSRGNERSIENGETTSLLGKPNGNTFTHRLKKYYTAKLDRSWADLILLLCYVVTGLLDSCAVFVFGCFVSMQTGNTIYLGLGLIKPEESDRWLKSAISIAAFCFGSFVFSRLHQVFVPTKRWVLMLSYSLQMLLLVGAALIVELGPQFDKTNPISVWHIMPLILMAIQSAGQAVTSRALKYNSVTSVVLTSNYTDLFSDPGLFTTSFKENPERSRRIAAPILLLGGALLGGLYEHNSAGLSGTLWTAVAVKAAIVVLWALWKADPHPEES